MRVASLYERVAPTSALQVLRRESGGGAVSPEVYAGVLARRGKLARTV